MHVRNVHERDLPATPDDVGALIDSLASRRDLLWPHERWPRMRLDPGLEEGATGGHGPIHYFVERHEPCTRVVFRFTAPKGFHGTHGFDVTPLAHGARLRHVLEMQARGPARLGWPLVYRPLHDALIEDALDKAATHFGGAAIRSWSWYVRGLRWGLRAKR